MTDRRNHWNRIYADKSPLEVSWYQQTPALSLRLIQNSGLGGQEPLIDVGGGASTLIDHLLDSGYQRPAVLDISPRALDYARHRLGDRAQQVEWFTSDITTFQSPHLFALWHDRAVFHFLTEPDDRQRYVQVLNQTVPPGGQVIIAAFAIGGPTSCSGLDIEQYDATKLLTVLDDGFRLIEQQEELHLTPTEKQQRFCYFRLLRV